ncbi:MAG: hypothetical protein V3T14_09395 [Myxococcota bacterium]
MTTDFEITEQETLRDTPEGELWTSVLVDGIESLERALDWLGSTYEVRRTDLEAKALELPRARYRERRRDLERERREREAQLRSCRWFFFSSDSPLDFICDVLSYPTDRIRAHARKIFERYGEPAEERDPVAA